MPIAGLQEVIVNILESISSTHEVKTWNIFYEQNITDITVRLKFGSHIEQDLVEGQCSTHAASEGRTTSYRRKSPSQIARDSERLEKYNKGVKRHRPERLFSNQETQVSTSQLEIYKDQQTQSLVFDSPVKVKRSAAKSVTCNSDETVSHESFDIPKLPNLSSDSEQENFMGDFTNSASAFPCHLGCDLFDTHEHQPTVSSQTASANILNVKPEINSCPKSIADLDEFDSLPPTPKSSIKATSSSAAHAKSDERDISKREITF